MAKYLDENGLTTLWGLIKGLFKQFDGASSSKDGTQGEVPAPKSATQDYDKFLKGDGTWATPENTEYSEATQSASGLMSATDKTNLDNAVSKLSGIANGAEVNQNAFSTVKVGTTSLSADTKTDTLTITAGNHITLTPTASSDSFSIAASFADATQTASGLMSSDDKTNLDNAVSKLSGIANGAEVNQNAFSTVKVGTTSLSADTKTDTLTITAGDHITLTPTETSDSFSIAASFADATQTASGLMSSDDKTKLDNLSESQVTGVKGNSETDYRTGQVNITAANIGLGNVDNTADANKSVKSAGTLTTARTIDGVSFNGSGNIIHYGTCSIAVGTAAKTCTDMPAFTLAKGARAIIHFENGNTASNPTLNIKSTGAKAIYYKGARTVKLAAGGTYEFVYDGTQYQLVGELDTNTEYSAATGSANGLMSSADYTLLHTTIPNTYATKSELSTAVSGLYKYKGSVATASSLPSNPSEGDVYNIEAASTYGAAGTNVAWNGSAWDSLGGVFSIDTLTTQEIQTICT